MSLQLFINMFILISSIFLVIIYELRVKKVDTLMKREDTKYTGHVNNTYDIFRMIKVLIKSKNLNKNERKFLKEELFLFLIRVIFAVCFILFNLTYM